MARSDPLLKQLDVLDSESVDLRAAFEAVSGLGASERGTYLEKLVVCLLRRSNVSAEWNPAATAGRQTDFTFKLDDAYFLGEAKWLRRPAGQMEADGLHRRLQLNPPSMIGCFVSMGGFAKDLLADIKDHREREIVLIDGGDIEAAVARKTELADLVRRKRHDFRLKGKLWFWSSEPPAPIALPVSSYTLLSPNDASREQPVVATRNAGFLQPHFALDGVNIETFGPIATLELNPWGGSMDLMTILQCLHARLDLEDDGSFHILQAQASWFGFGAQNLVDALHTQRQRYRKAPWMKEVHHSESFSFCASSPLGFVTVRGRQQHGETEPYEVIVNIASDGIPLDSSPFQQLARELDRGARQFRIDLPEGREEWAKQRTPTFPPDTRVQPVAFIRTSKLQALGPGPDILGLVIENPFRQAPDAGECARPALIPCRVRSALGVSDDVDGFYLEEVGVEHIGGITVTRVVVNWRKMLKCRCPKPAKRYKGTWADTVDRAAPGKGPRASRLTPRSGSHGPSR